MCAQECMQEILPNSKVRLQGQKESRRKTHNTLFLYYIRMHVNVRTRLRPLSSSMRAKSIFYCIIWRQQQQLFGAFFPQISFAVIEVDYKRRERQNNGTENRKKGKSLHLKNLLIIHCCYLELDPFPCSSKGNEPFSSFFKFC